MDLDFFENVPAWEWPVGAGEFFLEVLQDDQAGESDRILAADLAGDFTVINNELADELLSIVQSSDESDELRAKAVISFGPVLEYSYMGGFEEPVEVPITEDRYHQIQESLHKLFVDAAVPTLVRRRTLEAAVRSPQDWHREVIRAACSSDEDWRLTAVFCMGYIRGFDEQILEALEDENPDIHYQAVRAAGNWQLDAAWPHVTSLVASEETGKFLLIAAIDAMTNIRPRDVGVFLVHLSDSDDEEIVEAAEDAMVMAEELSAFDDLDEDEDNGFIH